MNIPLYRTSGRGFETETVLLDYYIFAKVFYSPYHLHLN